MAVFDIPAMMEMNKQDELQKLAIQKAQREQQMADQPDVDFTFEKGGLKVKGKLKDLPKLSQDPSFAPILSGINTTISNQQSLDNEEIQAQREAINERLRKISSDKLKQELEIAKGDTRTGAMELGLGLVGMKKRTDVMKELEAERGVLQGRLAELGFNKQTGQMDQMQQEQAPLPQAEQPAKPVQPAQPATKNFNSLQEA
ncbi:MAG: hypothetical protein EBR82_68395, partial [Caulobacteraceae bacterium]|nr:hypothetical protein [Caulobacteraceae bacterium]